jgi:hypothetical protein
MSNKYYIIPVKTFEEEIKASNPEEAMVKFAGQMDTDMNIYFRAVTEEELKEIREEESDSAAHDRFVTTLMKNTFMEDFGITDEKDAQGMAELAYDLYCEGDGETEYECIEEIFNRCNDDEDDDEDDLG